MKKLSQINEGVMTNTLRRFHTGDKRKEDTVKQPEMVDLGLSVKWASFNLGAQSPEEYGDYFAWGETEGYSVDDNSRSFDEESYKVSDYEELILDSEHDAATQILGDKWRIPTEEEWEELKNNTTITWETVNGIKGKKITSTENNNWIFLPVTGYRYKTSFNYADRCGQYWSSSLFNYDNRYSYSFRFSAMISISTYYRYNGFAIRPVYIN